MNSARPESAPAGGTANRDWVAGWLSFPAVLVAGLIVIAVLTVSTRFHDPDLWFHLKLGEMIWNTQSIPATETLSFTANGHAWTAHEWLAQLSIYGAYRAAGNTGLMLWLASLTSALLIIVFATCYRRCENALVSFLVAVCAWFFATTGLAVRPLLLGNVFLAIELLLLELGRRERRWFWLLPPLFAVWVNCHGSYYFGVAVLLVHWLCGTVRKTDRVGGVVLALCGLALWCNPIGVRLLLYPLDTLFNQRTNVSVVEEWFPPAMNSARGLGMLLAAGGLAVAGVRRRQDFRLPEVLVLAMATALAGQHFRMLFLFGIVLAPVLCGVLAPLLTEKRGRHPIANAVLISGCLAVTVWGFPSKAALQEQVRAADPVAAAEHIRRAGLRGPMLNEYVFGGYLLWALPEHKVFIDGRCDVFDWTGVLREYGRWATLAEDPQVLLDKYGIRFCLLRKDAPLSRVMPHLPGWRLEYSDDVAAVFVR